MSGGDGHDGVNEGARDGVPGTPGAPGAPDVRNQATGVVHGGLIQAGTIQSLTVRHPSEAPPVPRELPAPDPGFVNRAAELAVLDEALRRWTAEEAQRPASLVLVGPDGLGKTQLALEWADRNSAHFPDGQLYVDLAAVRQPGGAVDLGEVAAGLARRLGVSADFIPPDAAGRVAAYRSATFGRRLLLVIDNAEHEAEVRALLPRHGMVIVTSRRPLARLRFDGARSLVLDGLDTAACRALVRSWLDESEVSDATLSALVRVCGGRPLTLRAVGERLLDGSGASVQRVVAELTADAAEQRRLARASDGGDTTMSDAYTRVYRSFPPATRRLYRLLGALPGPTFPHELALGLGGQDRSAASAGLAELAGARLVRQLAPGHWAFPDAIHRHAATLADQSEREEALRFGIDFAVAACELTDWTVLGERLRLAGTERRPEIPILPELRSPGAALDWTERELATLLALLRAAAERGRHEPVWLMCQALWAYFHSRKPYAAWIEAHLLGIEAARWAARPDAELRMVNQLARAYVELGDHPAAREALEPVEALLTTVENPQLRGTIHETRGVLARATHQPAEAADHFRAALEANAGDERGMALQGYQLAGALLDLGQPEAALAELDRAQARVPDARHAALHARIGIVRGEALRDLGRREEAVAALDAAAGLAERLGLWAKAEGALKTLSEWVTDPAARARVEDRRAAILRRAGVL
ncbi:hypothetical protein FH609_001015 [Streptomyces sp. 3MP-14]|uniref:Tetratricopeptide repeat protein n=1 Tax=Streptomyces mimosae TaxID=2586635 RepID=A0A5N6ASD5_9ACTN|nr:MULTISPECIES: tetratricopeptide repeat protein [Streptomyces]KAB8171022.1 hypothetical protein FH607_001455 [Streptomyces mimosae]KAB8179627.1 hypothetical protein FH609_001015 [Streptomyces sp. 3MP-14]